MPRITYRVSIKPQSMTMKELKQFVQAGQAFSVVAGIYDQKPDTEHEPSKKNGKLPPSPYQKAFWNINGLERGHIKRDFISKAAEAYSKDWIDQLARSIKYGKWYKYPDRIPRGLEKVGVHMMADVKATIRISSPDWANNIKYAKWKMAHCKGIMDSFTGPLVRYGGLYDAIEYKLVNKRWQRRGLR